MASTGARNLVIPWKHLATTIVVTSTDTPIARSSAVEVPYQGVTGTAT
jgi:hypothetical protein